MQDNWRKLVQPEDAILHLGDLAVWYGSEQRDWLEMASTLPGKKFMLRGNHDRLKDSEFASYGFTIIPEFIQKIDGKRVLFSHYPDTTRDGWDINIHGHIHTGEYHLEELPDVTANINRKWINVSVEVMDYKPIKLGDLI